MPGNSPNGVPAASNCAGGAVRRKQEARIVAGVDDLDLARLGMQPQEDGGDVAAARLFTLAPVMLDSCAWRVRRAAGR